MLQVHTYLVKEGGQVDQALNGLNDARAEAAQKRAAFIKRHGCRGLITRESVYGGDFAYGVIFDEKPEKGSGWKLLMGGKPNEYEPNRTSKKGRLLQRALVRLYAPGPLDALDFVGLKDWIADVGPLARVAKHRPQVLHETVWGEPAVVLHIPCKTGGPYPELPVDCGLVLLEAEYG